MAPGEAGFDKGFFVALQHDGGVTSHVTGNWARQGDVGSRFRVDGAAATLVIPDDDGQTARLTAGRTPESEGAAWGTVPESRWGAVHRGGVAVPVPSERGDWSTFYTGFARPSGGMDRPRSTLGTRSPASSCSMPHGSAQPEVRWSSRCYRPAGMTAPVHPSRRDHPGPPADRQLSRARRRSGDPVGRHLRGVKAAAGLRRTRWPG